MSEDMLAQYRELSRHSVLKSGYIVADDDAAVVCESEWSTRNLSSLKRVGSVCSQQVVGSMPSLARYTPLLENLGLTGRRGEHTAWLVQKGGEKKEDEPLVRYILLHQPQQPPAIIDLSATKLHQKVYTDGELACLEFSDDCSRLAFVAEEHRPKPSSLLSPDDGDSENSGGRGQQFTRLPDWGEQLTGQHRSVVVVVPCKDTGSVPEKESGRVVLTPPPEYAGVGQLLWAGPDSLVGVAYIDASPRLGLIYCPIREAVLFYISLKDGLFRELTPRGWWVGSPRLSPDGGRLVYLRGPVGGTHISESQLITRPWGPQPQIEELAGRVVVDYVSSELSLPDGSLFAGLVGVSSLPLRCFLDQQGSALVLTTWARFAQRSYAVNLESGAVSEVLQSDAAAAAGASVQVLDATPKRLLYTTSSFCRAPSLCLATVTSATVQSEGVVRLVEGARLPGVEELWVLESKPPHPLPQYDAVPLPALYCGPANTEHGSPSVPLIVYIHGGPHSAIANSMMLSVNVFVSLGYAVVFPNYRGSLGVGSDGIHSLPGYCGDMDVKDCHAVVLDCLNRHSTMLDSSNVFLYGGSHGGFLVTSLSARYPDFYRAVASVNPVTDMVTMVGTTDIPDWVHVEAGTGQPSDSSSPPSTAALNKMAAASPVFIIDKVRAPTLLMLGSQDRRVPLSQGWKYHELLKHRGVPTSAHVYPDHHNLSKVDVEADGLLLTLNWFKKYAHRAAQA